MSLIKCSVVVFLIFLLFIWIRFWNFCGRSFETVNQFENPWKFACAKVIFYYTVSILRPGFSLCGTDILIMILRQSQTFDVQIFWKGLWFISVSLITKFNFVITCSKKFHYYLCMHLRSFVGLKPMDFPHQWLWVIFRENSKKIVSYFNLW